MKQKLRSLTNLFACSGSRFMATNSFEKGASLSYYTVFALPPILLILISLAGTLFGREAVSGQIYSQLRGVLGPEGAMEVQSIVQKVRESASGGLTALIGVGALLVAATGAFVSMQDSLNAIWCVKPKPRNQLLKLAKDRLLSFGLILCIALLILVSLATNAILVALQPYIQRLFTDGLTYHLMHLANIVLMLGLLTLMFASIYKFLPDVNIGWRDVWMGGFVTALLFSLGRSLLSLYLGTANPASMYGAAGTIVLLLVWVFYSSQILFFGAIFTREYARLYGRDIYPSAYAVRVVNQEVELGKTAVTKDAEVIPLRVEEKKDPYASEEEVVHREREEREGGKPL